MGVYVYCLRFGIWTRTGSPVLVLMDEGLVLRTIFGVYA